MPELDLSFVDQTIARCGTRGDAVIPILQAIQAHYRYLPQEALKRVCDLTEITPAAITGVATFYTQFRHRPVGRHIIKVCHGTACHVKGSGLVQDALERRLAIDRATTPIATACSPSKKSPAWAAARWRPVVQIDGITYGHVAPASVGEVLDDFLGKSRTRGADRPPAANGRRASAGEIRIGLGSCCIGPRQRQSLPGSRAGSGRKRGRGRGQTRRLRGHVPSDAAGRMIAAPAAAVKTLLPRRGRRRRRTSCSNTSSPRGSDGGWSMPRAWLDRLLATKRPTRRAAVPSTFAIRRSAPFWAGKNTWPPNTAARSIRRISTNTCDTADSRPCGAAWKSSRRERSSKKFKPAACAAAAGRDFPPGRNGPRSAKPKGDTKYVICNGDEGDPAHSWTA